MRIFQLFVWGQFLKLLAVYTLFVMYKTHVIHNTSKTITPLVLLVQLPNQKHARHITHNILNYKTICPFFRDMPQIKPSNAPRFLVTKTIIITQLEGDVTSHCAHAVGATFLKFQPLIIWGMLRIINVVNYVAA